ncbi:unnamed protein product [Boreogadus saida]
MSSQWINVQQMLVREQTKRLGVQISCSVRLVLLACVVLPVKSAADLNQQPDYHLKKSSGSDVPGGTWRTGLYRPSTPRLARDHAAVYQKRNWCPHTVSKTVTCQVQNGTVLQRVYQSCVWPQGCSGASYKTLVRPSYRLVYRTVTSLEWRCCPGFSGAACEEGNVDSAGGLLVLGFGGSLQLIRGLRPKLLTPPQGCSSATSQGKGDVRRVSLLIGHASINSTSEELQSLWTGQVHKDLEALTLQWTAGVHKSLEPLTLRWTAGVHKDLEPLTLRWTAGVHKDLEALTLRWTAGVHKDLEPLTLRWTAGVHKDLEPLTLRWTAGVHKDLEPLTLRWTAGVHKDLEALTLRWTAGVHKDLEALTLRWTAGVHKDLEALTLRWTAGVHKDLEPLTLRWTAGVHKDLEALTLRWTAGVHKDLEPLNLRCNDTN